MARFLNSGIVMDTIGSWLSCSCAREETIAYIPVKPVVLNGVARLPKGESTNLLGSRALTRCTTWKV